MFDIELLKAFYRGMGVKVAIIDTGMGKAYSNDNYFIENYFYDYNKKCINKNVDYTINECSTHGIICGSYILEIAPKVTLLDFNVENEKGEITDEAVCSAIEYAVKNKCDIINISLGFEIYSEELLSACKNAYESKTVVIAAASNKNFPMFPADFGKYVVKIIDKSISGNGKENISKLGVGVYSVELHPYTKTLYNKNLEISRSVMSFGSSIACAFFSAILALYIESRPFQSKNDIINMLFEQTRIEQENAKIEMTIKPDSSFAIISSYYDYSKYISLINENITGYYDLLKKTNTCFARHKSNNNLKDLYVINPLNYPRLKIGDNDFMNVNYIGEFENLESYRGKRIMSYNESIKSINTPIILIVGVGTDCGKFNVQLELKKQMQQNKFLNYYITYNPLGIIFGIDYLMYPSNDSFSEIVYSINEFIKKIENEKEYECIIIDVAGGMFPLSRINTNQFGMVYNAYMNALPVDYIVICTNSGIDPEIIKKEVERLELYGNNNIAIVISELSYDELGAENSSKNLPYKEDKIVIEKAVEKYRECLKKKNIFEFKDVVNGLLYNDIIKQMT